MPFSQFNLHPQLVKAITALGFKAPTPIQTQAIPPALEGRDILGCAQTGSGKTAAFALPVLHHLLTKEGDGLRALVLVPTRELAVQVERTFKECSRFTPFKTAVVIGGVSHSMQTRSIQNGAAILVATPGRLLDHLRQGNFSLKYVEQLVLDEADRMLDMGFLPEIKQIINTLPKERQTQLFSATLHEDVERIAAFATRNPLRVEIARPSTVAEGISQILYPVIQSQKSGLLLLLLKNSEMRSVLVFTRTKHGADKVASRLQEEGYKVGTLHSNRSQNQRQQAMDDFRQMRTQILVATDIAARGIDVKNISHVVNFDVPRFPEDYVHRVGRTARAYGVGDALLLVDPMEESFVKSIERFIQVTFPRATLPGFQYNKPPKHGGPPSSSSHPRGQQGKGPHGRGPQTHRSSGSPRGNAPSGQDRRPTGDSFGNTDKRPTVAYAFRNRNASNSGNSFAKRNDRPSGGRAFGNTFGRSSGGKPSWNKRDRPGGERSPGNSFPREGGGSSFGNKFDRPSGGKPFWNKKDRPAGERSPGNSFPRQGGGPSSGNTFGRPSGGKPFWNKKERPGGERSPGNSFPREGGRAPFGNTFDRPSGGKPFWNKKDRPAGERSFGNKFPRQSGNTSERPNGGKSFGGQQGRPSGGNPFGQKHKRPGQFKNKF